MYSDPAATEPMLPGSDRDLSALAMELGNPRGVNVVLLGTLSTLLEPAETLWIETISDMLPAKIRAANIEGFKRGAQLKVQ